MTGSKRFIEIAQAPARISFRNGCVVVRRDTGSADADREISTPVHEIGCVLLTHPQASVSQPAMVALMKAGGSILVSDDGFSPIGMMLPLVGSDLQTQRMLAQVSAKLPLKKQIWKQIVVLKVKAQAAALDQIHPELGSDDLRSLAERVRSGDPENIEGQAAARYWPLLMNNDFRRRVDAVDQNRLLNYGYAIIRACVARSIVSTGLHPSIGVHHKGRNNPFCLADDLMEPYRPLVDIEVAQIVGETGADTALDSRTKARLISILDLRLHEGGDESPTRTVADHIARTAWSLCDIFLGSNQTECGKKKLFYPRGLFT